MDDIPPEIIDRPAFTKLSPDDERAFLRVQAEWHAAYRRTGDPLALWEALSHVQRSGQTVPDWLRMAFFKIVIGATANSLAERYRERERHVRRYICVRDLRETVNKHTGKKHTKDEALDQTVKGYASEWFTDVFDRFCTSSSPGTPEKASTCPGGGG